MHDPLLPILPGAAVGVLGSGQLGRMFAIAARRMGYRVHCFSPDQDTPTGQVADLEVTAPYEDLDAVRDFARHVGVVTFEFENVPTAAAEAAEQFAPVRPAGNVLHVTQHRLREKTFLARHGFPVTPFRAVRSEADLRSAIEALGLPAILKTAGFGYDGKGQTTLAHLDAGLSALRAADGAEMVLEAFVNFEREVSVVAARGADGSFTHWGLIENAHANHILDLSTAPAHLPAGMDAAAVEAEAVTIARGVLEQLEVVGVLCVEFFLAHDGKLLVNELAPRPHNSGHLTFDASVTSQFEQQLRAVCGLPLGSTRLLRPAAMANLLGDLWFDSRQGNGHDHGDFREPNWAAALAVPNVKLHLYGKSEPRLGRKMGHLTALADTPADAAQAVRRAREALRR